MPNQYDEQTVRLLTREEIARLSPSEVKEINDKLRPAVNLTGPHKADFKARCEELGIRFKI